MKVNFFRSSVFAVALLFMTFSFVGCGPKDDEIKADVEKALQADPSTSGTTVTVSKGVVTLSGECPNPECKANGERIAGGVKNVKSVVSNTTVAPPPPPPTPPVISADDQLNTNLKDALKDYPTVTATVADGVVTLAGTVEKSRLRNLMQSVMALHPKKVESAGLVKK